MKAGSIYHRFTAENGAKVTLRALRWEDLDDMVRFINSLVEERSVNSELGIIADKTQTREQEAEYVSQVLRGLEKGDIVSVVAEVGGRVVANSDVRRGQYGDTRHHGHLGIAILRKYRGLGIGLAMMKTLIRECRKAGLKTVQLEVFSNNARAIHVYKRVGFEEVGTIPKKMHRGSRFYDSLVMATEL